MKSGDVLLRFDRTRDPVKNLSHEERLFQIVDAGGFPEVVRFWVNSECLVRGKARNPRYGWYHEKLATKLGIRVLERSTGGGVVYHDEGNLNWAFYFRTGGAFHSPTSLFDRASKYIVHALENLGVYAVFSAPNRIDVGGRKVSGMAARSTKKTALIHGTLLLDSDLDKLNLLCIPPAGSPPVANLVEWKRDLTASQVVKAVTDTLAASGFQVNTFRGHGRGNYCWRT